MPTKIIAKYDSFGAIVNWEEQIKIPEFYCQESPLEVLRELGQKYHIKSYRDIESIWSDTVIVGEKNKILFSGLKVKDFRPENGLGVSGSIKDYKIVVPEKNQYKDRPISVLSNFISKYLFEVKDPNFVLFGDIARFREQYPNGYPEKRKVKNYMKTRRNRKDEKKEKYLEQILEYSNAIFGKEFGTIKTLKKLSEKIQKHFPTDYSPYFGGNYLKDMFNISQV